MKYPIAWPLFCFVTCGALVGCAFSSYEKDAANLMAEGRVQEAILLLKSGSEKNPVDTKLRAMYLTRRAAFVDASLQRATAKRNMGEFEDAKQVLIQVLEVDAQNARATDALSTMARDKRGMESTQKAKRLLASGDAEGARAAVVTVLAENPDFREARQLMREIEEASTRRITVEPSLRLANSQPVSLEFKDANVRTVFEVLARSTGINFLLDKDVRPDLRTTVYLRETPIEEAVNLILQTSQLERKVLNANTVLVYPSTPEKIKAYQDLVVKAFFLRNTDAKQVQNTLKTMLKTRDIVIDEKLNLVMMRDTPDAIRLAEKLVAIQDLQEPEVMLELEVLEIQRSKLTNLGIQWPNQLSLTPLSSSGGSSLTVNDLRNLNASSIGASVGGMTLNLRRDVTDTNLLANPRVRVRNRESAKILIGDRLPVVTTSATATGLISESIQYLDVGLKLDAQPDIRLRDDVGIKLSLEVSSIVQQVKTPTGSLAYQIGTRTASTVLQMREGETQILAGLISDQERSAGSRIPYLGDLPVLNRIFGSQQDNRDKTEIVLSITPRIVRNLEYPIANQVEFWSGTEANLRSYELAAHSGGSAPVSAASAAPSGATRAMHAEPSVETSGGAEIGAGAVVAGAKNLPAKAVSLSWDASTSKVSDGDAFQVTLKMKADGNVRSLPLQIGFSANAVQIVKVTEGEYFRRNGRQASFTQSVDLAGEKIFVTAAAADDQGPPAGDASLLVLFVKPLNGKAGEIRVLNASAVVSGGSVPVTQLPPPFQIDLKP